MDDIYFSHKPRKASDKFDTQQLDPSQYYQPQDYPQQVPQEQFFGGQPYYPEQQYYAQPPQEPQKKPKRRKKHKLLRALVSLILIVCICIPAAAYAGVFSVVSSADYVRGELNKNQYVNQADLWADKRVTNILLIGVDEELDSSSRSDSMILVSIDMKHKKIKLTSFLRDSWVEIPSKGKHAKLNSACSSGGPQLVVDTLEYNFGVDIEHFVMVDFEMFTKIIDELGGVDVEVTEKEASFINRTTRYTVDSGSSVHLDGNKALVYCRIRKLDSDYMRTFRQRKVITALISKAKQAGIPALIAAAKNVFPLIETDMSASQITSLAFKGGASLLTFDICQNRIPTDELGWGSTSSGGQSIVELDLEANKQYLHDFIYTDKYDTDESSGDNQ